MLLCLNKGFLQISDNVNNTVLVSVKDKKHLETYFPKETILSDSPDNYYVIINNEVLAKWLYNYSMTEINYTNFKDSVVDNLLHDFYCRIWNFGYNILALGQ